MQPVGLMMKTARFIPSHIFDIFCSSPSKNRFNMSDSQVFSCLFSTFPGFLLLYLYGFQGHWGKKTQLTSTLETSNLKQQDDWKRQNPFSFGITTKNPGIKIYKVFRKAKCIYIYLYLDDYMYITKYIIYIYIQTYTNYV